MADQGAPILPRLAPPELQQLSQQIRQAVADLHGVESGHGWRRVLLLIGLAAAGGWTYWQADHWAVALAGLLLLSLAESGLLITTHDALHGTLLALPRWESLLSCLISWPMAWPCRTYGVLHLWHHRWNNLDCRDPERISPCHRPWLKRALVAGGVGLIVTTVHQAWLLRNDDPRLLRRLACDSIGIVLLHGSILWFVVHQGVLGQYLLSWLLVERIAGGILQTRALVEHWGLWRPRQNYLLSQLYGSRSIQVCDFFNAVMGGLPYHSAHHLFPGIPFNHLPQASCRIESLLTAYGLPPLPRCPSYLMAVRQLR